MSPQKSQAVKPKMRSSRLLVVLTLSLLMLWQVYINTQNANDWNAVNQQLTLLRNATDLCNDKVMESIGDQLYYSTSNISSVRSICDRLDKKIVKVFPKIGRHRFNECMDALQMAKKTWDTTVSETCSCHDRPPELFHAYWTGTLTPAARLSALSVLYTYPAGCAKLKIWVTDQESEESILPLLPDNPHVEVLRLDVDKVVEDIVEIHPHLKTILLDKALPRLQTVGGQFKCRKGKCNSGGASVGFSNVLRVLVLAAYGGVYVDLDVLVLQPMTPLYSRDFYYKWRSRNFGNTAILHFRKGSCNLAYLLEVALENSEYGADLSQLVFETRPRQVHGHLTSHHFRQDPQTTTVEVLPCSWFDPLWILPDNSEANRRFGIESNAEFFSKPNQQLTHTDNFFQGGFALHWHNRYDSKLAPGSTSDMYLQRYEQQIAETI